MKQTHGPQAYLRKQLTGAAVMGVATLAMAGAMTAVMQSRIAGAAGTPLALAEAHAAAYGITEAAQLDEGLYRITGTRKGFKSDVVTAVTLSADGTVQTVEILMHDETESLGGHCTDPEFLVQYAGVGPYTLAGKDHTVTDPATGAAYASAAAAEQAPAEAKPFDAAAWRAADTSPEAEATRAMYMAGLLQSAQDGEALNELIPAKDNSPEAVARKALHSAELSQSAKDGEAMTAPRADWSAEKKAIAAMAKAGLLTAADEAAAPAADLAQVDALSGATITSAAVTDVVNSSYFYVTQVLG